MASDKGMGRLKARFLAITVLLAVVIIGCEPGASQPLMALQAAAPVSTCDDLGIEIVVHSSDEENDELGSLLKIYDIEQTSHSNTRLKCAGNARTTLSGIDDELVAIEFYKFTDEDGDTFIGYVPEGVDENEISEPARLSSLTLGAPAPTSTLTPKLVSSDLPAEVPPTPTTPSVETVVAIAPTELPAAEVSPTPLAIVPATPTAAASPEPDSTPLPTPEPTPTATSTPVPTATVIPTATPVPIVTDAPQATTPDAPKTAGDLFWEGESSNRTTLGEVETDFTISATVFSPHDNQRGLWSWGVGITVGDVVQDIFVLSDSQIIISDPSNSPVKVTTSPFLVRESQNSENKFHYRAWNGVVTIYVNGIIAATIEGLWDEPGEVSLATNYPGSALAQGFLLRSTDVVLKSTKLLRDDHFDGAVTSEQETLISIDTGQFDQLSAVLENPLQVSGELLDFGFRVGLPVFEREIEIKQAVFPVGVNTFHLSLTHKPTGTLTWQKTIRLDGHNGGEFDLMLREFDGAIQLVIDGTTYPLAGLEIDFDQEHLEDVIFFVNSDERVIDSDDARFQSSPYVRVSKFGLWND